MSPARVPRRPLLAGLVAALTAAATGALTGCTEGPRQRTEDWLRSRPWVASIERLEALGGPVPLPGPASLTAEVTAVPGTDRAALNAIRAEIEEYASSHPRDVQSLLLRLSYDRGRVPISGTPSFNDGVFPILDRALADPRAERIDLDFNAGLKLDVTVPTESVLPVAQDLTGPPPGRETPTITVRDTAGNSEVITTFSHAERIRTLGVILATAGAEAEVRGFRGNTISAGTPVSLDLASRDRLAATFRALRTRWDHTALDLTVSAGGVGLRGPAGVTDRLPAAFAAFDAAPFTALTVQDNEQQVGRVHLIARVDDPTAVAQAARAIGDHPEAVGTGTAWLLLDPIARVRLVGSAAEVAACGGPAQACVTGPGEHATADSQGTRLRLYPGARSPEFPGLCRAIRAAGWPGSLDFEVNGGPFTVSYRSTEKGRAENVETTRAVGTVDGSAQWIRAWDDTATE